MTGHPLLHRTDPRNGTIVYRLLANTSSLLFLSRLFSSTPSLQRASLVPTHPSNLVFLRTPSQPLNPQPTPPSPMEPRGLPASDLPGRSTAPPPPAVETAPTQQNAHSQDTEAPRCETASLKRELDDLSRRQRIAVRLVGWHSLVVGVCLGEVWILQGLDIKEIKSRLGIFFSV